MPSILKLLNLKKKPRPMMLPRRRSKDTTIILKKEDESKLDRYRIEDLSLQTLGAFSLFDEINQESMKELSEFIIKSNYVFSEDETITILINSPGGDVFDGFGIVDLMECSRLDIQTVGIGLIASMASLIFIAGTEGKRIMSKNSWIMTHQFFEALEGKYHELLAQRDHQDQLQERFVDHFKRHSGMSEKQIKDIILGKSDNWISPKEALKFGLCDEIRDPWD